MTSGQATGGLAAVDWSAWPKEDVTFSQAFNAITNIVFAYSFAVCQFSFMDEMHTTKDYVKSIWALGLIEIFICAPNSSQTARCFLELSLRPIN